MKKPELKIKRFDPDFHFGLSTEQVESQIENKLVNQAPKKNTKSYWKIIAENTFTFFNLIWAVIFIALLCVKAYNDLLFVSVIVLNTLIAIIQECKAKRTVEKLKLVSSPKVKAIRNGEEVFVWANDLVLDDIIILESGNQIAADLIICDGSCEVNESLLTGESNSIKKISGDILLAGSFLTSGRVVARVDKVGKDLYISSIAQAAKSVSQPQSNLFRDLKVLIRYIGAILVPVGALMFVNNYIVQKVSLELAISKTCGSITGMIPAGMFLLVTIALSVGVVKLAKRKTLVQDLYSIEMLARSNVLCLDKTGTITDGTMGVKHMEEFSSKFDNSKIISSITSVQPTENATSQALIEKFGRANSLKVVENLPFSSERKQTITSFEGLGTFALGAPEYINYNQSVKITKLIAEFTNQGYRVLLLAHSTSPIKNDKVVGKFTPLAIVVIEDHIRKDAEQTIKWFSDNGVEIKIISGDNPQTVSHIAKRVGVPNSEKSVSLEKLSPKEVADIADKYTVFGRVSPEQKLIIIKTLKQKGKVVAMTGDGVNDTLALKEADCSIAMADGSEVARSISKLVLLDSKFSSLPKVVEEGRQVIGNVQNSATLFLMKTFFTLTLSVLTLLTFSLYPFAPSQMFLLECFVIGLPSFFLALLPNKEQIKGEFLSTVIKRSLPYAAILLGNIGLILVFQKFGIITIEEMTTCVTLTLALSGFLCLVRLCYPFTAWKIVLCALSIILIISATIVMPEFFKMTTFSPLVLKISTACVATTASIIILWIVVRNSIDRRNHMLATVSPQAESYLETIQKKPEKLKQPTTSVRKKNQNSSTSKKTIKKK